MSGGIGGSGMFASRHAAHRLYESVPSLARLGEHALPLGRYLVEPAAPFIRLLDPRPLDPSPLLETVQQWIERIDVERQLASRTRVDQLAQLVAVPRPHLEQREN